MGAIKRLLPSNWCAIKDEDIESLYITSAGFEATMTVHDDNSMSDSFGHTFTQENFGSIKDVVKRLVMSGFNVEVNTKQKKEELT